MIAPCICENYGPDNNGSVHLDCSNQLLDDKKTSDIFDAFLLYADINLLVSLTLFNNSLTRVPEQIRLFPRLVRISLATNKLRTIERALYFPPTIEFMEHIGLDYQSEKEDTYNQISQIEPGAFQCESLSIIHASMYVKLDVK